MGDLQGLSGAELYARLHPKPKSEADKTALPSTETASGRGELLFLSRHGNRDARRALTTWQAEQAPEGEDA